MGVLLSIRPCKSHHSWTCKDRARVEYRSWSCLWRFRRSAWWSDLIRAWGLLKLLHHRLHLSPEQVQFQRHRGRCSSGAAHAIWGQLVYSVTVCEYLWLRRLSKLLAWSFARWSEQQVLNWSWIDFVVLHTRREVRNVLFLWVQS